MDGVQFRTSSIDTDALLDGLTEPQAEAVRHTEGPLLVLAAAGSGKTRVITRRIAYLVAMGVPPWSILALTFTNKAAGEMRDRVHALLDADPRNTRGLTVTTFHSLCARLLRRYADMAELPGLKGDFTIYDSSDQVGLMKRVIKDLDLTTSNWPPRSVLSSISAAKNQLLDADAFGKQAADFYSRTIAKIYAGYERGLRTAGAVDFDDLLMLTEKMLRERPDIRAQCNGRWQYLLIDEYQDTNHAQLRIATHLAGEGTTIEQQVVDDLPGLEGAETEESTVGPNVCVVGDPDQSIYGWRGADISNILEFEEQFPGATTIALGQNFRSSETILGVADTLIRNNKRRKHKPLFTTTEGGDQVEVVRVRDEHAEARLVVDWFKNLREVAKDEGGELRWSDCAVFYRNNSLSRVMEDAFRENGIPYIIARGTAFYEREEIKNALGYLRVIANPADDVSLIRVVNTPTRGIGKTTIGKLQDFASLNGRPLFWAMQKVQEVDTLADRARNAVTRFVELIDSLTGSGTFMGAQLSGSLADLVERVVRESTLEAHYQKQAKASGSESDEERLSNLDELISSAADFEDKYQPEDDPAAFPGADVMAEGKRADIPPLLAMLRAYLEQVALVSDQDKIDASTGAVTLMTLHAAKGLEFPAVAMIGLEEGLLPHSRAQTSEDDLEEERRLCFVGITRAMRRLHITGAKYRTMRGMAERTIPSRFLEEFGRDHAVFSDQADDFGSDFGDEDQSWADPYSSSVGSLAQSKSDFPPGCRVRHPQFGTGKILSVSSGSYARAKVQFDQVGTKTLVLEYARLTRV